MHCISPEIPSSCVVLVYGPTASGKTRLAIEIARKIDGEIISVDSRQIYQWMNIGTGKVTLAEMQGIPHWWLDLLRPDEVSNAAQFRDYARAKIADIQGRGKVPILCGGTGLYIDAVLYDLDVPAFVSEASYQAELEVFRVKHGNLALWERLHKQDPEYANEIHPNSYPFVMRALEVKERTGKSKRDFHTERSLHYPVQSITPYAHDRDALYTHINERVEQMFSLWLLEEVQWLLDWGYSPHCPWLKTIGYKEVIQALHGEISREEAQARIAQWNRNYAKRQITWNKRYESLPKLEFSL